jgi:two-component system phosphate regulon response regulator PhoB
MVAFEDEETLTILVVEDDEALAELLRTLLNRVPGWGATVVHDAAAAREVCHHVRVEVFVVDVNLPGISGLELLTLLRADPEWRDPPVILMSARPDQPEIEAALAGGQAGRFIAKPFDVDDLIAAVHDAVAAQRADQAALGPPEAPERTQLASPGEPLAQALSQTVGQPAPGKPGGY